MTRFRSVALHMTASILIATASTSLYSQTASPPIQVPSIAVSIALERDHVPVGKKPQVVLTIRNISKQEICFSTASNLYRIHVDGEGGEPPKTEMHRHSLGDFRPGDGPALDDGPVVCSDIAPGASAFRIHDLSAYYDLSVPGKYTVYLEILDEPQGPSGPGVWLRTNTAQFEVQASAQ